MALGANDMQPTQLRHPFAQLDIRTAPSHVRGNGDSPSLTRSGDNFGLLLVILCIEDRMHDTLLFQQFGNQFADFD